MYLFILFCLLATLCALCVSIARDAIVESVRARYALGIRFQEGRERYLAAKRSPNTLAHVLSTRIPAWDIPVSHRETRGDVVVEVSR